RSRAFPSVSSAGGRICAATSTAPGTFPEPAARARSRARRLILASAAFGCPTAGRGRDHNRLTDGDAAGARPPMTYHVLDSYWLPVLSELATVFGFLLALVL